MLEAKLTALMGFDTAVIEMGGNPADFLSANGLEPKDLNNPQLQLPLKALVEILHHAARKLDKPELGMRIGSAQDFSMLGPAALAILSSKTLMQALYAARSINVYHNNAEYWRPIVQDQFVYFRRFDLFRQLPDTRQYKEMSMAACCHLGKLLLADNFADITVEFEHSPMSSMERYRRFFPCAVKFNCEQDQLIVPKYLADAPLPTATPKFQQTLERLEKLEVHELESDFKQQVIVCIQQMMSSGHLSIESVCEVLAKSKRTLQRRLKEQGTDFKTLLETIRMEKARWYLVSSDIDVTLISEIVGYTDVGNFSRAFKRVNGLSPANWRLQN